MSLKSVNILSSLLEGLPIYARGDAAMLREFIKSESGATAMEYGFIAGLVSLAILTTVVTLGASLETGYAMVNDKMVAALTPPPSEQKDAGILALFTDKTGIATLR
jgi:pilus assembly protein Flp/PilA